MHSLSELKELFIKNKLTVSNFSGWKLSCFKDEWTMSFGVFHCNGKSITNKEINSYIKKMASYKDKEEVAKAIRCAKKIKPNKGYTK